MESVAGNGGSSTNDLYVNVSNTFHRFVQISNDTVVISHTIIWKNNTPTISNYYTQNADPLVSLIENQGWRYKYIFWRRSGTLTTRVQEFV